MATDPGYVSPKPGIPKTLGILNIIFGTLAFLVVGCTFAGTIAAPAILEFSQKAVKEAEAKQEEGKAAQIKALDEREKTETSDEQKAAIAQERAGVNAQAKVPMPDMTALSDIVKIPTVMSYNLAYMGTGVLLTLMLLVSGIMLVRLARPGRSVANAWATLQIAQLILFAAINVLYVQPAIKPTLDKMIVELEEKAKAANAPPQAVQNLQMIKAMRQTPSTIVFSVVFVLFLSIYPVLNLILLNTPGARAAFPGPTPTGLPPGF